MNAAGGLAGVEEPYPAIDTAELLPDEARRAEGWVEALFRLAEEREPEVGTDLFRYELEVREAGGGGRTAVFTHGGGAEGELPDALRNLLEVASRDG